MAKLNITHTFSCTPDAYWAMYWDTAYDDLVNESAAVTRTLVSDRTDPEGVRHQVVQSTPDRTLPPALARVVGAQQISYRATTTYYPKRGLVVWRIEPSILPSKIVAQGEIRVVPHKDGCQRRVVGEIVVKVRFVGGLIESAIVDDVTASYTRAAAVATRWLAKD